VDGGLDRHLHFQSSTFTARSETCPHWATQWLAIPFNVPLKESALVPWQVGRWMARRFYPGVGDFGAVTFSKPARSYHICALDRLGNSSSEPGGTAQFDITFFTLRAHRLGLALTSSSGCGQWCLVLAYIWPWGQAYESTKSFPAAAAVNMKVMGSRFPSKRGRKERPDRAL